jgi:hypothetical protein
LKISRELREYCGFDKVPDGDKITRFKQRFVHYIKQMFDIFVEITEPICREIDAKKADYLIYDPTGIKVNVAENNPKFLNTKINNAKKLSRKNPQLNAHSLAYASMPESAKANLLVKQQYINGHFCYAFKAGILANGIMCSNASSAHSNYDKNGTPVCPIDKTPFNYNSICGGKNRSQRIKWSLSDPMALLQESALAKLLVMIQNTADVFTLTRTKICVYIPESPVVLSIGTTSTDTEF